MVTASPAGTVRLAGESDGPETQLENVVGVSGGGRHTDDGEEGEHGNQESANDTFGGLQFEIENDSQYLSMLLSCQGLPILFDPAYFLRIQGGFSPSILAYTGQSLAWAPGR